jgi:glutamate racemase
VVTFGFFDSGIGGLSVLKAFLAKNPDLNAIYLADTAWVPYGTKDPAQLRQRIAHIVSWLSPQVDQLVVACNTSAALMQGQWNTLKPVIDPIQATEIAFKQMPVRSLAIMATPNTVASQAYVTALKVVKPNVHVVQCACPGLADAVEANTVETMQPQLAQWVNTLWSTPPIPPEHIVLGCTHYPFAANAIQHALQSAGLPAVSLFDPAVAMADQLVLSNVTLSGIQLFTTGNPDKLHQQVALLDVPTAIQHVTPQHLALLG